MLNPLVLRRLRRAGLCAAALCGLSSAPGCSALTVDPMSETRFEASPDGRSVSFVAPARGREDLTAGEPGRMRMLGLWLRQTATCPEGYDLVSRKTEERPTGGYTVYYVARCRAAPVPPAG